jgi:PRTRC genetic system protein A
MMFINHIIAASGKDLRCPSQCLYEYVVGSNGVFVRAKRPGLEAMIPVSRCYPEPIKGLEPLEPYVRLQGKVPEKLVTQALLWSIQALPNEALVWFGIDIASQNWTARRPEQYQRKMSVKPTDPFDEFGATALIDLHSHNSMPPFFSTADDRDETGFRIYAVIGSIHPDGNEPPAIRVRVGIYGHVWTLPAADVFNLPPYLVDANIHALSAYKEEEVLDEVQ